jgi:beta-lactamase regulating signal transducer with metallopeptidase domain
MSAADLIGHAWSSMVCGSVAVAVVLLFGLPLRAWFGAGLAYASWLLVPIVVLTSVVPRFDADVLPTVVAYGSHSTSHLPPAHPSRIAPTHDALLLALWAGGSLVVMSMAMLRHYHCVRLSRGARPDTTNDTLRVVLSDRWPYGPATIGWLRPLIVLPADFETRYSVAERALVLQHEAVHVRRHDVTWNLLATLIVALGWFNPLLYVAWHRFRRDQELACDETVVRRTGARRTYAEAMFKTVRPVPSLAAVCGWPGRHSLQERIVMLNKPGRSPARRRIATAGLAVSLMATTAALYASDLSHAGNAKDLATVRLLVMQANGTPTESTACVAPEQRIVIPYARDQRDFGNLGFRIARAEDGEPAPGEKDQWEVHDIATSRWQAGLNISSRGFYGVDDGGLNIRYIVSDTAPVHATWDEGSRSALKVRIYVSPGCDLNAVAAS